MSGLPLAIKVAVATVMVVSIWRALYGPPPDHRDVTVARLWGITAAVLYTGSIVAVAEQRQFIAWLLLIAGVVSLCMAFYYARGDDDGGGGGGDDSGDDIGPIDWDRFDRARRQWERPRVAA